MQTLPMAEQGQQYKLNTDDFARLNQVKGASVRARLCRTGSYFGIVPAKLANGRLGWPATPAIDKGVTQ